MNDVNKIIQEISDINDKVNEMIPGGRSGPDYECEKTRLNVQVVGNGPDHDDPNDNRIIPVINENLQNIREKISCILDRNGTIRYALTQEDIKYLINIANNELPHITFVVNGTDFNNIIRMARLQRTGGKRKNKKRKSRKKRGGVKKKKGKKVPNKKSINKKSIKKVNSKKPSKKESPKHDPTIAEELAAVGSDSDIDLGEFDFDLHEGPLPSPTITETWKPAPGTISQLKAIYQEMGNNSSSDDDMDDDGGMGDDDFNELMAELAQDNKQSDNKQSDNKQSDNKQPDNKKEGGHRKKRSRKRKTYRRKSRRKKKSKRKTKRKGRR